MPASNREWTSAASGDDVACLRPTASTTSGTGGLRPRAVRSRTRAREHPAAAQEPPSCRIPIPLLEEAQPTGATKLRHLVRKRLFCTLQVALSCAAVLLVIGISMHVLGLYDFVAIWLVSVGVTNRVGQLVPVPVRPSREVARPACHRLLVGSRARRSDAG
ncbi:hypothetical protein MRX96_005649 [Rhipicephalus microplus]